MSDVRPINRADPRAIKPVKNDSKRKTRGKNYSRMSKKKNKKSKPKINRTAATDPRFAGKTIDLSSTITDSNANPSLDIVVPITTNVMSGIALTLCSFAVSRGYSAAADNPYDLYFSWIFLTGQFQQYAANGTLNVPTVPSWINLIGQALVPKKNIPVGSGKGSYVFKNAGQDYTTLTNNIEIGPGPYGYTWNFTNPTSPPSLVNGIFNTATLVTQPYNPESALQSWSRLLSYVQEIKNPITGKERSISLYKEVAASKTNKLTSDSSAFASIVPSPGGGFASTGGWGCNVQSEVPIRHPLFSVFNVPLNPVNVIDPSRYPRFVRNTQGDIMSTTGQLLHLLKKSQIAKKAPVNFKFIDFNEFVEVLAYYVQGLQTVAANDPEAILNNEITSVPVGQTWQCPVTLQDASLALRAVMMSAFKDTQFMAQGLYPRSAQTSSDNEFIAYLCTPSTCSLPGTTNMMLPQFMIENIRDLTYRINTGGVAGEKNPALWIPVLGQYYEDVIDQDQFEYTYNYNGGPQSTACFTSTNLTVVRKIHRKNSKTKLDEVVEVKSSMVQSPIDFIDGRTGTSFVQINDPAAITIITNKWNAWLSAIIGQYSTPLTTLGTDGGLKTLLMTTLTRHWINQSSPSKIAIEEQPRRFFTDKLTDPNPMSPYASRAILAVSSHDAFFGAAYETIQQNWISPINYSLTIPGVITSYTFLNRVQELLTEPHLLTITSGETVMSLSQLHYEYAMCMVRMTKTATSSWQTFLTEQENHGRGGILSTIGTVLDGLLGGM